MADKPKAVSTRLGRKLISRFSKLRDELKNLKSITELPEKLSVRSVNIDLRPRRLNGTKVQAIRESFGLSQNLFAQYLGVGTRTLQFWEQGVRQPSGAVLRVIEEMVDHPEYWQARLNERTAVSTKIKPRSKNVSSTK